MAVTTAAEAVLDEAGARRVTPGDLALMGAAVASPLLALALRCALWRGHIFLRGDLALMDLSVRRAAHLQLALGPYDRFGWHHPGPAYFYLLALIARVVGTGLQAQAAGAALINGLAVAGAVLVVGRLAGRRAALCAGALLAAVAFAVGPEVMFNPWTPYVVILPLALACLLAVGAMTGSSLCLSACVLVATFAVETDVGTGPIAALAVLAGLTGWVAVRRRTGNLRLAPPAVVLLGLAVALWVPPVVDQLRGSRNLSLILRFMTAHHAHSGLGAAADSVGAAQLRVIGVHVASAPWGTALPVAAGAAAVGLGVWRRFAPAWCAGIVAVVGTAVSIAAGTVVVGPVYPYLVEWSVVLPLLGGAGVLMALTATHSEGGVGVRSMLIPGLALTIFGIALLLRVTTLPALGTYSAGDVEEAWSLIRSQLPANAVVEVDSEDPAGWAVAAGLADEIEGAGLSYTVPARWAFQYGADRVGGPAQVVVYLRQPSGAGAGRRLGVAGPVSVWLGAVDPSGRPPAG